MCMTDDVDVATGHTHGWVYWSRSIPSEPMTGNLALSISPLSNADRRPSDDGFTARPKYLCSPMKPSMLRLPVVWSHESLTYWILICRPQTPPWRLTLLRTASMPYWASARKLPATPSVAVPAAKLISVGVTPVSLALFWPPQLLLPIVPVLPPIPALPAVPALPA